MREILFKGKRIDNGEWVYGNYAFCDCYTKQKHYIFQNKPLEYAVDENTICQYTGLTDKNGNKIWENDVIQYIDGNLICNGIIKFGRHVQIVMIELGFYVDWLGKETESFKTDICYWTEKRDVKVIGNIFDNLEMIGE